MIPFEYEKTKLEDGYYVVQVTEEGETGLVVAEHTDGSWAQCGIDYDVWQYAWDKPDALHIVARVHLTSEAIALEDLA